MDGGIFVSEKEIGRLKLAFDRRSYLDRSEIRAAGELICSGKPSFDQFYHALYLISLSENQRAESKTAPEYGVPLKSALQLDVISAIEIPRVSPKSNFKESLIDEIAVADLLNFRNSIISSISLPTRMHGIELGCVYMCFNIYASPSFKAYNDKLPGVSEDLIRRSPHWQSLFSRYKVKDFHLKSSL